jgi:hypothetical protein
VIDFRDESRANLQRALDAEALLEKVRSEKASVDEVTLSLSLNWGFDIECTQVLHVPVVVVVLRKS